MPLSLETCLKDLGRTLVVCAGAALLCLGAGAVRADDPLNVLPGPDTFVHLAADEMAHDDAAQRVIATGHVEFIYDERVLKADRVEYDLVREIVTAHENVVLMEQNGDVHFMDTLEMTRDMKDGYARALRSTLADGSRFWAAEGNRAGGQYVVMKQATYTPCELCKIDPTRRPQWQIRADQVVHDNGDKSITYQNAWMEMWGVPMMYVPYFSHPDGTIQQKSGFLTPIMSLTSQNGANVTGRYYWAIDPTRDATFETQVFSKQSPRLAGEYRQRFNRADLVSRASFTYAERRDSVAGDVVTIDQDLRGHFETTARWDIDDKWRAGADLAVASDEQYLRQYDITSADVLENQLYVERFENRDYATARLMAFQDLRTSDRRSDQPNILPEIESFFYGDPGDVFGGRWKIDASALGLERSDEGDDVTRLSTTASWQRRHIADMGLVTTFDTALRGDWYHAISRESGSETDKNATRLIPYGQVTSSYPLVKPMPGADMVIEPIAALTLIPRQDPDTDVPNEDSQDSQLDASNLFEPSRFPGLDRVEDLSRVTYGVRTSLNGHDGGLTEVFLGQSYRLDDRMMGDVPANSGLTDRASDYVGRVKYVAPKYFTFDYGFQLSGEDLRSVRHEIDQSFSSGPFALNTRYLYAEPIEGVGVDESREQFQAYGSYKFYEDWQFRAGANYDLGADPGLRKTVFGLDYLGQCLTFSATLNRNLTSEASGESGSELMLRIGFKNLGEFETSGISVGGGRENTSDNTSGLPVN
jgi:LPS-assembly protein